MLEKSWNYKEQEMRKTEIAKAAKRQKINKRTQAPKRPHKTISKTSKLIISNKIYNIENIPSWKSSRPRRAKYFEDDFTTSDESSDIKEIIIMEESDSEYEEEEYFYKECKGKYKNGELWMQWD